MKLHRYVEQQRLHITMKDRHSYLSSSWVIRPWLIWKMFLTCSSFTIWNIWMKLHRYVDHQRLHIVTKDRHSYLSRLWVIHPWLYNMADVFRLTFLNARSLHRHLLDLKNDFNFQVAEVICFCETRFDDRDTSESTSLNGFHQYRQDSKVHTNQNQRTPYGMALYTSEKLHIDPSSLTSDNIEIMLSEINRTEIKIILVNIYSPPKTTTKTLIKVLTNIHHTYLNPVFSVIMGDFNIDMNSDSPGAKQLAQQMTNLGYRQLITSPTCDTGSIIILRSHFHKLPRGYGSASWDLACVLLRSHDYLGCYQILKKVR